MKLVRFGPPSKEKPGLIDKNGRIRDLSAHIADIAGVNLTAAGRAAIAALDIERLEVADADARIGPAVGQIGKIICVGLNYSDHAAEAGMATPKEPVIFAKATSAVSGPFDDVLLPRGAEQLDWEVELGVVIGDAARHVSCERALEHVAGYVIVNDVSERAWQLMRGGQWMKGKSYDSFAPIGPWLVTPDEITDPQNLRLTLNVNGVVRQNGTTKNMIFTVAEQIAYLSEFMTLNPGDVISTGTPAGVGLGLKPPVFLKEGDVMELEIDHLGIQRQRVVLDPRPL